METADERYSAIMRTLASINSEAAALVNMLDEAVRERVAEAATDGFLSIHDLEPTETMNAQLAIFINALTIFDSRKIYGDIWQRYGSLSNLLNVARKVDRLMQVLWYGNGTVTHKDALDDAYDLINYAAFFIRNQGVGNERGFGN